MDGGIDDGQGLRQRLQRHLVCGARHQSSSLGEHLATSPVHEFENGHCRTAPHRLLCQRRCRPGCLSGRAGLTGLVFLGASTHRFRGHLPALGGSVAVGDDRLPRREVAVPHRRAHEDGYGHRGSGRGKRRLGGPGGEGRQGVGRSSDQVLRPQRWHLSDRCGGNGRCRTSSRR